jgi:hypothetical protein
MSTLAIKQLIATLEEKLQNSPTDASVKAQLKKVYAERDAQEKVVADAAAAKAHQKELEQKKLDKKMKIKRYEPEAEYVPPPPAGRTIQCCDCSTDFFFAQKEEELFAAEGMQPRKRCAPCLQIKKDKHPQPQPIVLECVCKAHFIFTIGSQKHFKAQGWAPPKRCPPCREAKKTLRDVVPVSEAQALASDITEGTEAI